MEAVGFKIPPKWPGMSLRDWLAGKALQGVLVQMDDAESYAAWAKAENTGNKDVIARVAYAYADAMLKERVRDRVDKPA